MDSDFGKKLLRITVSKHNSSWTADLSMGDQARKVQKVDGFGTEVERISGSCTPFTPPPFPWYSFLVQLSVLWLVRLKVFDWLTFPFCGWFDLCVSVRCSTKREEFWFHYSYIDVLRSEEHTSELQSRQYLVCRLLLEKKKKHKTKKTTNKQKKKKKLKHYTQIIKYKTP